MGAIFMTVGAAAVRAGKSVSVGGHVTLVEPGKVLAVPEHMIGTIAF